MKAMRTYNARLSLSLDKNTLKSVTVSDSSEAQEAVRRAWELGQFLDCDILIVNLGEFEMKFAYGFDNLEYVLSVIAWKWLKTCDQLDMLIDN